MGVSTLSAKSLCFLMCLAGCLLLSYTLLTCKQRNEEMLYFIFFHVQMILRYREIP